MRYICIGVFAKPFLNLYVSPTFCELYFLDFENFVYKCLIYQFYHFSFTGRRHSLSLTPQPPSILSLVSPTLSRPTQLTPAMPFNPRRVFNGEGVFNAQYEGVWLSALGDSHTRVSPDKISITPDIRRRNSASEYFQHGKKFLI